MSHRDRAASGRPSRSGNLPRVHSLNDPDAAVCLLDCPLGQSARLCMVAADPALRRRLAELGLRCGMDLTATQRTSGGGCVVAAGDTRVALDRSAASALRVIAHAE